MDAVFDLIWKMGGSASTVVWFVLIIRLCLLKAPKVWSYALWALVLLRLVVPVFPESGLSLMDDKASAVLEYDTVIHSDFTPAGDSQTVDAPAAAVPDEKADILLPSEILRLAWPYGIGVMLLYGVGSLIALKRKLRFAVPLGENVYEVDYIGTPFVLGIFRPKIYLPSGLENEKTAHIIAHERCHIRRLDHVVKAAAFVLLCIHWTRPMLWVAFWFMCWDVEMSCDEAVLKGMADGDRAAYADTLLHLSAGKRRFLPAPLAFGEGNPKKRIWNILDWKKPRVWVTALCILVVLIASVCLLTDPAVTGDYADMQLYTGGECVYEHPTLSSYMEDGSCYRHIAVCDDDLFLFSNQGEWLFSASGEPKKTTSENGFASSSTSYAEQKTYTREELVTLLAAGREESTFQALIDRYPGQKIEVWTYYNENQSTAVPYSLYYFDGELTWFAQGEYLRLFEVEKLPESGAFEPAVSPWQWTANLTPADISYVEVSYWDEEGKQTKSQSLNEAQIREFVEVLNGVPRENVITEGQPIGILSEGRYERLSVQVRCGAFSYHLKYVYSDGEVSFMFDREDWAARYHGNNWYLDDAGVDGWMNRWFEELKNG